jgi:ABC-type branched-subunit amino acid transport system ATPase component
MLELKNIAAGYKEKKEDYQVRDNNNQVLEDNYILRDVKFTLNEGDVVGVIGKNGAGKSTLTKVIMNDIPYKEGVVYYRGGLLDHVKPHALPSKGIGYFPQGGRVFHNLTAYENLLFAGRALSENEWNRRIQKIHHYIPFIDQKNMKTKAGYLSGGKKHLLALAMVLMQNPSLLILDEPSAGLSDANVDRLYDTLKAIKQEEKVTILLIEHRILKMQPFINRLVILKNKKIEEIDKNKTIDQINQLYASKN